MGVAPRDYGEMLLRLGVARLNPALTASGSSPSPSALRRRLAMLQDVTVARSHRGVIVFVAVASALVLVPFQIVARTQTPAPPAPKATQSKDAPAPASATKPATIEKEQIEQALAEQRARDQRMEQAVRALRAEFEALLARHEALREQGVSQKEQEQLEAFQRIKNERTQQFLESQLAALKAEQEALGQRSRQLSAQVEQIRKQLEAVRSAKPE